MGQLKTCSLYYISLIANFAFKISCVVVTENPHGSMFFQYVWEEDRQVCVLESIECSSSIVISQYI